MRTWETTYEQVCTKRERSMHSGTSAMLASAEAQHPEQAQQMFEIVAKFWNDANTWNIVAKSIGNLLGYND